MILKEAPDRRGGKGVLFSFGFQERHAVIMGQSESMGWYKLQLAFGGSSSVSETLKEIGSKLLEKRASIKDRIAELQKTTYGRSIPLTAQEVEEHTYTEADEKRINYYLGNLTRRASLDKNTPEFNPENRPRRLRIEDYESIRQAALSRQIRDAYTLPLLSLFELLPARYKEKKFLYRPGDNNRQGVCDGIISKTRRSDDLSTILLKLNPGRHWKDVRNVEQNDIPYQEKKGSAVWRGATTGNKRKNGRRIDLVTRFFDDRNRFDVGYSCIRHYKNERSHLRKDVKSLKEQLRYKILICLEGNDVASGLKWMLQSHSVVMMPNPTVSSWLMEDQLEPFVHYIPVADDFSDIEEQFDWAMSHEAECIEISNKASQYMSQFLDPRREILMECEVLRRYLDNIDVY